MKKRLQLLFLSILFCISTAPLWAQVSIPPLSASDFKESNLLLVSDGTKYYGVVSLEYVVSDGKASTEMLLYLPNRKKEIDLSLGYNINSHQQIYFDSHTGRATIKALQGEWNGSLTISPEGNVLYNEQEHAPLAVLRPYLLTDSRGSENIEYPMVKIGTQVWLRTNLSTLHLNDGTPLALPQNKKEWMAASAPAVCYYDNSQEALARYGAFYNWHAAKEAKLAPIGWRVTSLKDWEHLAKYLDPQGGSDYDMETSSLSSTAGELLKSTNGWSTPSNPGDGSLQKGSNRTFMTVLPAGSTSTSKFFNGYSGQGFQAYFWTTDRSDFNEKKAHFIRFFWDAQVINCHFEDLFYGYSIRCLLDSPLALPKKGVEASSQIILHSAKAVGEKIRLMLTANGAVMAKGIEEPIVIGEEKEYTISSKEIQLIGDITSINCAENRITELSFDGCKSLAIVDCSKNALQALDLKGLPNLHTLLCSDNDLHSLDLSASSELSKLWCSDNPSLSAIDLTQCPNLLALWCYNCNLSKLDLSRCHSISGIDCFNNQIETLILGSASELTRIYCYNNNLSSLPLENTPNLDELNCSNNLLTDLQFARTPYLSSLNCANNSITLLNVSNLTNLTSLYCQKNRLTELDLKSNRALEVLHCYENQIGEEKMGELIRSLRSVSTSDHSDLMIINTMADDEKNRPLAEHIAQAKAKGWTPKDFQGGVNNGNGVPFAGFTASLLPDGNSRIAISIEEDGRTIRLSNIYSSVYVYDGQGHLLAIATPQGDRSCRISLDGYRGSLLLYLAETKQVKRIFLP